MATMPMHQPLSLTGSCAALTEFWSPRILAQVNDQYVKVARVQGEFPWHQHDFEDELFLVLQGALTIGRSQEDGGPVTLLPGEIFVVPRGVRHNTSASEETWIALVETVTTQHTGSEQTALTRSIAEQLGLSAMRHATLIVNPAAGRARLLRAQMTAIEQQLAANGYNATVVETTPAEDSAILLAAQAASTSQLVLACGGDGTVHQVVQALAHTDATLGVIPLGTANALARNLGLPLNPLAAVTRLMTYKPRRIPLGQIETRLGKRLFVVMAGSGPDGLLVHTLSQPGATQLKARFGRAAYYGHAAHLFCTRSWPAFRVRFRAADATDWHEAEAIAVMASRVPNLGGIFSATTPLANLTEMHLHVQIVRRPGWLSLPAWMVCGRLGLPNPWLTTVEGDELLCEGSGVYTQADAEGMGQLPMRLSVVPDALSILMSQGSFRS